MQRRTFLQTLLAGAGGVTPRRKGSACGPAEDENYPCSLLFPGQGNACRGSEPHLNYKRHLY